jgi:hypothetical protein
MADKKISALTVATTPLAGTEVLPIVQSGTTKKVSVDDLTIGKTVQMAKLGIDVAVPSEKAQINNGRLRFLESGQRQYNIGIASGTSDWVVRDATFGTDYFTVDGSGNIKANTGNLVIGTAGKGIDFSADPSAAGMTSELLDDYEEGTWTPALTAAGISGATYSVQTGQYTKVGNRVMVSCKVTLSALTSGGTNYLRVTGLPFAAAQTGAASVYSENLTGGTSGRYIVGTPAGTEINFWDIGPDGNATALGLSGARLTATSSFIVSLTYSV